MFISFNYLVKNSKAISLTSNKTSNRTHQTEHCKSRSTKSKLEKPKTMNWRSTEFSIRGWNKQNKITGLISIRHGDFVA